MMKTVTLTLIGLLASLCTACNWSTNLPTSQSGTLTPTTTLEMPAATHTSDSINTNQTPLEDSSKPTVIPYPYPVEIPPQSFITSYPGPIPTRQPPPTTLPLPTATRILPPSPVPIVPTIISRTRLDCVHQDAFAKCRDDTLGIAFEYPVSWAAIEAVLRTSIFGTGYAYEYYFIGTHSEHLHPINAGGRSKDFGEPREGTFTDFRGYGDESYQDRCDDIKNYVPICREIQPNVILTMHFPKAQFVCDPAPGSFRYPIAIIEINLPNNSLVNGFVFVSRFLSEQQTNNLNADYHDILGLTAETMMPTNCAAINQAEFDSEIEALIENIRTGSTDEETNNNIQQLEYMASSVTFVAGK